MSDVIFIVSCRDTLQLFNLVFVTLSIYVNTQHRDHTATLLVIMGLSQCNQLHIKRLHFTFSKGENYWIRAYNFYKAIFNSNFRLPTNETSGTTLCRIILSTIYHLLCHHSFENSQIFWPNQMMVL